MTLYLYVKTHNITGLKYFGKTYRKDPSKYLGSGVYWRAHLKKHGNDVTTEIVGAFEDLEEATRFALKFSKDNDIVASPLWANLIDENAVDGYAPGHPSYYKWTEERRAAQAERARALWADPEHRARVLAARSATCEARLEALPLDEKEKRLKDRERSARWKRGDPIPEDSYIYKKPPEFSQKVSAALKGRPKTVEHKQHLSEARRANPREYSDAERQSKSAKMTGRTWIHFEKTSKMCTQENLPDYLAEGWQIGRAPKYPTSKGNEG